MPAQHSGVVERIVDGDKSKAEFHIVKTMNCDAMVKALQELPDHVRYKSTTQAGMKHICSLPPLIAVNWMREWGVPLYGTEFNSLAANRIKNDPNWQKLRVNL